MALIIILLMAMFTGGMGDDSWDHTAPTLKATCKSSEYAVEVTFAASPTNFTQVNEITIAQGSESASTCLESGVAVTTNEVIKTLTNAYGTKAAPGCGTGAAYETEDALAITYTTSVRVTIKQQKAGLQRFYNYDFNVVCSLTRSGGVTVTSEQTYNVTNTEREDADAVPHAEMFVLPLSLNFLDDSDANQPAEFTAKNNDLLKVVIKETTADAHLKFTVQNCYVSNNRAPGANGEIKADIITDECNVDDTVVITPGPDNQEVFKFETRAFTLVTAPSDDKFSLHCEVFVCFADEISEHSGKCKQNTAEECSAKLNDRRRRDVGDVKDEIERKEIVSSTQTFVLSDTLFSVQCPPGFVFDRSSDRCTQQRLVMVKGVQLKGEWVAGYGNSSSSEFRGFASSTEHQLHALMMATGKHEDISGIAITEARQGSLPGRIIVDLVICHADDVQPADAFATLKDVLYNTPPRVTRLVNLINVDRQQVVPLVHVGSGGVMGLNVNVVVVVITVVVIAVVLVCGLASYQMVRNRRRQDSSTQGAQGVDNVAMEKGVN